MKKTNNNTRYRNGSNNNSHTTQIFSLNYRFDSNSIAGKTSGTALELIKRYNDLARDASSNGDRVNVEIFRQYAEHYRKIVTDINDKRNVRNNVRRDDMPANSQSDGVENEPKIAEASEDSASENLQTASQEPKIKKAPIKKKEFTVVELKEEKPADLEKKKPVVKPRRVIKKSSEEIVAVM